MKNSCITGGILGRAHAVAKLALALLLVSTMVVYVPALPSTGDPLAALPAIAVTLAVASACCLVFVGYARRRRE